MRLNYGIASALAVGSFALASAVAAQEQPTAPPLVIRPPVVIATPEIDGPPPPRPSVITNPRWARAPQPAYPERAIARGIEGRARLECVVMATGRLTDCKLLLETPEGAGFGVEALAAARTAIVAPRTMDGLAVAARATFNVDFKLADPVEPLPAPPPTPQP